MIDPQLEDLVRRNIARFDEVPVSRIGKLLAEQVYSADRKIYRISVEHRAAVYALKVRGVTGQKQSDLSNDATDDEYRRMERAYSLAARAGLATAMPIPLACFTEHRAILTTWCSGSELRRKYYRQAWRWPLFRSTLPANFRDSGTWLGRFHAASKAVGVSGDVIENRLNHVDRMLDEISRSPGNRLSRKRLDVLRDDLSARLAPSRKIETGYLHGNFTLRNILVSPAGAVLVDFEDSREDAIHMDTGQIIADVLLSAYRPFIRSGVRRRLIADFLSAYGEVGTLDPGRIRGFAAYHILATYYETLGRDVRGAKEKILAARQALTFSRLLSSLSREVDRHVP